MKSKKILIIFCLILCLFLSLSAISAADNDLNNTDNDVLSVNDISPNLLSSTNDDLVSVNENSESFTVLNGLVTNGGTVTLNKNYTYGGSDSLSDGITITKDVTIIGEGNVIIDANSKARIFNIDGATVTLKGITFTNGVSGANGGAILTNKDSTLIVEDCTFEDNSASRGGGILIAGANSIIKNSTFKRNYASYTGNSFGGGAIEITSTASNTIITNCSFEENHAGSHGGAIAIKDQQNHVLINESKFIKNYAYGGGGSIFIEQSKYIEIINNTFEKNYVTTSNPTNAYGGAIHFNSWDKYVNVTNCSFVSNNAGRGGAIRFDGLENGFEYFNFYNLTFENNYAIYEGGGFSSNQASRYFYIENCTFINCTTGKSNANGGGMYLNSRYSHLKNITFINCSSQNGGSLDIKFNVGGSLSQITIINSSAQNGGAARVHDTSSTLSNVNIINSNATGLGGAIYWTGSYGTLYNINITNSLSKSNGGAIYWSGTNTYFIENISVINSSAVNGGGIYLYSQGNKLKNITLTNCTATTDGGALYINADHQDISNVIMNGSAANRYGGAIYVGSYNYIYLNNLTVTASNAYNGGGFYYAGCIGSALWITNCNFTNNNASHNGGAIYYVVVDGYGSNSVVYRDYNKFDGEGIIGADGRTTVTLKGADGSTYANHIRNTYFYKNYDYSLDISSLASTDTLMAIVNVSSPNDPDRNSFRIVLNVSTNNVLVAQFILDTPADYDINFNRLLNKFVIQVRDNLTQDTDYVVSLGFEDANYLYKESTSTFRTANVILKGDFLILQGLIDAVAEGGTLNLPRSFTFTAEEDYSNIQEPDRSCMNITKSITINGNGFTLNALDYSRIFNITADNVVLNNINFINGNASGILNGKYADGINKGGAIFWAGDNGVINNSAIMYNYAEYGAGIYYNSTASDCNVTNNVFANNNAIKNGGAIDCNATRMRLYNTTFQSNIAEYGAALCREADATGGSGKNNTFVSNHATNAGAALAWMRAENIYIDTYTFIDNTADYSGGAIYVGIGSTNCTVFNSTFTGNNVTNLTGGHGGAIEWYADTGRVLNSTFVNNNAYTGGAIYVGANSGHVNITNSGFLRNNAITLGGAIDLVASSVRVNNSYFRENTAENGGAIFVGGSAENSNNNYIFSSYFTGNNATGRGGAVDWNSTAGNINKTNFTGNLAEYGGAVYVGGASANSRIENVIFTSNNATKNGGAIDWNATVGELYNTQFISNYAGEYGAALCRESGATGGSGKNNTFKYNHADIAGAAIAWLNVTGIHINDYHFYYNTANASGAAIFIGDGSDNCGINGSVFVGNNITNKTGGHGGAIDIVANNASVSNSNFTDNNAFYGGAIFVGSQSGHTNITNARFKDNTAVINGGAINLQASGVTLNGTYFEWNVAYGNGGAVYVGGEGTTNVIYNSDFVSNVGHNNGGAIYWRAYAGHIEDSNFTLNSATNGGAIYLNGVSSNTNITHVIFDDNNALKNGGAIDCNSTKMNLTYTLFKNNYAGEYGAALCREKNATSGFGEYNNFTFNHAGIAGAALAWLGVENINIKHYIFTDNYANVSGGAIYADEGSNNYTIDFCVFKGNNVTGANGQGGAIDSDSNNNTIKNSNFTNNHAYDGGAIHVGSDSGQTNITNATFTKNGAYHDGGAINLIASGVRLNDTRFYNNTATNNGGAVYVGGEGTTNVVVDSLFDKNEAGNHGGAIDWIAEKGEIKYINFTRNSANDGGALYLNGRSSGSELSHLIFEENIAVKNGGAIDCNATLVNLTHTRFTSNTAEFGAALCREAGATGGFGVNNTFDKNHATKSGAALAWLGVANIHINNYTFTNNTADYSGGAIYVGPGSDNCIVDNSTFIDDYVSNAIAGRGGAIDWIGNNGTVKNTTFTRCISVNGGGIYVDKKSDNMTIENTTFTSCSSLTNGGAIAVYGDNLTVAYTNFTSSHSKENGAAIAGFSSDNANISYCNFKYNLAAGYVDPNGSPHGEGGAIYWTDSKNLTLSNSKFDSNGAHLSGGTISADNCSDSLVFNITTHNETAATSGGSIAWINSNNVTINLCFLDDPGADYNGGAIYLSGVNATVNNTILNSTWAAWGTAGGIYVDGNVTINNVTFNDTHAMDDNATAIYFASGISTLSNSNFTNSYNSIGIAKGANVTLIKNNLTADDPNKSLTYLLDNTTLGIEKTRYAIWNDGNLSLEKNNFDYVIINNGTITSLTHLDVLDNRTWNVTWNETFTFFANITDDNYNTIISVSSLKTWNNHDMGGSFNMSYNQRVLNTYFQEEFIIYGSDLGLTNCVNRSGTIRVKMPTNIEFNKTNIEFTNDVVRITTYLKTPVQSNFTVNGQKLKFKIGDREINATLSSTDKWIVATTVLSINNWTAGTHTITATYDGDNHHWGAVNTTSFEFKLRASWIKLYIENVTYGQTAYAVVTTNSNGTVRFNFHSKSGVVEVHMTKGADGNYTGTVEIPVEDYLTTGIHDAGLVLEENQYYEYHVNQTTFEVYKLNTTVGATPITQIKVDEKEVITVIVNENYAGRNATGFVNITIAGETYYKKLNSTGGVKFNIYDIPKGEYNNVKVSYEGDDYFNGNSTLISFTVGATSKYNMTVKVDNVTYGQNATIYIVLPISVSQNLTVYVNNTKYENVTVKDGLAIVNVNFTVLDTPGQYVVNVTYPGDEVYALKYNNGTKFNVKATNDWVLNLDVAANPYGQETTFTVTVPSNIATKLVNLTIDGEYHPVTIDDDGTGTLILRNLSGGLHTVIANYTGDSRYVSKTNSTNFLVEKASSTTALTQNADGDVIATVTPTNVTGSVTFYINGREYTVNLVGNTATLDKNNLTIGNNTILAIYNGDINFTSSKDSKNITVAKNTAYVNVTATNETYGKASEITVKVPTAQEGYVTITVNDTLVNVTVKIVNGEAKFNATGLDVGRYIVNVTYLGDATHDIARNHTYFNITKNSNLAVEVIGQNVTVKENASFVINITDDFKGKVNITIDGVSYYDDIVKSLVIIDKLPAGTYTANVTFYGDDNYNNKSEMVDFTVSRVTPTISVTIDDVTYPSKSVAIVNVSDYANGTINITVDSKHFNKTITNGHVEIDLTGLSGGVKDALVNFTTSDNYNSNLTANVKFNINKAKSTVIITQVGQNVIATVTTNATGNVTFYVNGEKYTRDVNDEGKAILENVLRNGNNTVVAIYSGDRNFTSAFNSTNNTVDLKDASVKVNATNVTYGNASLITVEVPAVQKGYVRVVVNGTDIDVVLEIKQGIAKFNATGLNAGLYRVNVTYLGDGTYGMKDNFTLLNISKANLTASVIAQDVTVDENASFIITVLNDFKGNVSIEVDGIKYNGTVKTLVEIEKLIKGAKRATVTFYGDDNYNVKVLEPTFTVSAVEPVINVTITDTTYPNNATAIVKVSGKANGTVEIKVGTHTYTKQITNGEVVIDLDGLDAGLKEANVTFTSTDDYNLNANATYKFFISKAQSHIQINVTPEGLYAGDDAIINITVSCTGKPVVYIDDEIVDDRELENNRIIIDKSKLTVGKHTVVVYYPGDNNYESSSESYTFTVEKREAKVNVTVKDTPYNDVAQITVQTPIEQTGFVTITVGDKNYTAKLANGEAKFNVTGLEVNKYKVDVTYHGDENYTVQTNDTSFNITQITLNPTVLGVNVTDAMNSTFIIVVPDDYGGQVTITVDGETYTGDAASIIQMAKLDVGEKIAHVVFADDKNYKGTELDVTFNVTKAEKTLPVTTVVNSTTVVVTVPENVTGNVTVILPNGTNKTAVIDNGSAIITLENMTPGENNITVIYTDGNNTITANATITVPKYDTQMNVTVSEAKAGGNATVTVEVPKNATGTITVTIDGKKYATDNITDGVATITIENLTAGNKTLIVEYSGDENYTANYTLYDFTVAPGKVESEIIVVDHGNGTVVVVIGDNATGNVTIKVGDKEFNGTVVNGTAIVNVTNVTPGIHEVEVIYSGDGNHTNATATADITAPKYDTQMNVTVGEAKEGEPINITVEVPVGATGDVIVYVGGENHTGTIDPATGKAIVTVENISAGDHTIAVEYAGDGNYSANYTVANMTVEIGKSTSEITVVDQGNGTVVVVVGDNATGNVTVKVGDETYNATVINGTAVITLDNVTSGTHNITVIYSGDDTHSNATANATITVKQTTKDTPISITVKDINVGDTATVVVTLPENVEGNVTIEIDGVKYTDEINAGKATFEIENLTAGLKSVFATFAGDETYAANFTSAQFNVSKVATDIKVEIEDAKVGENVTVTIRLPNDATGQILIDIEGVGYYANVTDGVATAEIPYLPSGNYEVNLTYTGDGKYLLSSNKTTVKVEKIPSFVIPKASNIVVGENEVIRLYVPVDATGNVTLVIDGEEYDFNLADGALGVVYVEGEKYTVAISGGNGELTVSGLPKGEYTVSVKYNGDKKYLPSTNSTIFTVSKIDTKMEIVDQGNGTILVILPENATGNVSVTVENKNYTADVKDGIATVVINDTAPGVHDITVKYSGDNDYSSKTENSTVNIPKYETPIFVLVDDIKVGETAVVIVSLPENATGKVTIEINGEEYTTDAKDGKAVFNVDGLAYGNKTVAVTYEGDNNYVENFTTGQFEVAKNPSTTKATSKNINVGKDEVITVTVPSDATGRVLVDIDGVGYYADIVNGKAKVIIPNLEAGKYKATVTYEGDDKYLPSSTEVSFTVSKVKAPVSATGDEIKQGENGTVIVKVPGDATGTVTIEVNGKTYTQKVENGQAIFSVPGLKVGDYPVSAYYSGDEKYEANDAITEIIVIPGHDGNNTPHHAHGGVSLTKHATGNPILLALLIVLAIGSTQLRRFRK